MIAELPARIHTDEAISQRGEVFTPAWLVKEMLDKLPQDILADPAKTVLDNSCGNGNFLIEVLHRRLAAGIPHNEALSTIYGVELDAPNAEEGRVRLLLGSTDQTLRSIVDHNIICADALDEHHAGWDAVGFYWDDSDLKRRNKSRKHKHEVEEIWRNLGV